jgi:hypothetical protein
VTCGLDDVVVGLQGFGFIVTRAVGCRTFKIVGEDVRSQLVGAARFSPLSLAFDDVLSSGLVGRGPLGLLDLNSPDSKI